MAKVISKSTGWIGWIFFLDLLNGLFLTLSYMFSRTITLRYPDKEKWVPDSRHRGHHFLKTNDEGDLNCVACELCAKICPCFCIKVAFFIYVFMWFRFTFPRYRYDQLMTIGWKVLLPLSLANILISGVVFL